MTIRWPHVANVVIATLIKQKAQLGPLCGYVLYPSWLHYKPVTIVTLYCIWWKLDPNYHFTKCLSHSQVLTLDTVNTTSRCLKCSRFAIVLPNSKLSHLS